jgi:hypothetical protein
MSLVLTFVVLFFSPFVVLRVMFCGFYLSPPDIRSDYGGRGRTSEANVIIMSFVSVSSNRCTISTVE